MTVEVLQTLSLAAFIAAGVLLLVSVALFFLLDVPKLYGDISGKTAKKAIEAIRQQNQEAGNKAYQPHSNESRGKLTDKITPSGRIQKRKPDNRAIGVGTEKFATESLMPKKAAETTVLASETTLLAAEDGATTVLAGQAGETTVLTSELPKQAGETTVLTSELPKRAGETAPLGEKERALEQGTEESLFTVDVEMSFIGSSEIIE